MRDLRGHLVAILSGVAMLIVAQLLEEWYLLD
jgi:hypothetical protein